MHRGEMRAQPLVHLSIVCHSEHCVLIANKSPGRITRTEGVWEERRLMMMRHCHDDSIGGGGTLPWQRWED